MPRPCLRRARRAARAAASRRASDLSRARRNRAQSGAIERNWKQSKQSEAVGSNRKQSEAIGSNQEQSGAIGSNREQSPAASRQARGPRTTCACCRPRACRRACPGAGERSAEISGDDQRRSTEISGDRWGDCVRARAPGTWRGRDRRAARRPRPRCAEMGRL